MVVGGLAAGGPLRAAAPGADLSAGATPASHTVRRQISITVSVHEYDHSQGINDGQLHDFLLVQWNLMKIKNTLNNNLHNVIKDTFDAPICVVIFSEPSSEERTTSIYMYASK